MHHRHLKRAVRGIAAAVLTATVPMLIATGASAQSKEPIKIGYSMALTGGLAPNGKSALLAQKIWEEDVNAKGGQEETVDHVLRGHRQFHRTTDRHMQFAPQPGRGGNRRAAHATGGDA